jgi:hypothetical protein
MVDVLVMRAEYHSMYISLVNGLGLCLIVVTTTGVLQKDRQIETPLNKPPKPVWVVFDNCPISTAMAFLHSCGDEVDWAGGLGIR